MVERFGHVGFEGDSKQSEQCAYVIGDGHVLRGRTGPVLAYCHRSVIEDRCRTGSHCVSGLYSWPLIPRTVGAATASRQCTASSKKDAAVIQTAGPRASAASRPFSRLN